MGRLEPVRSRNPKFDVPDAHELALAAWARATGRNFKLIPSTPAQRRARAWYWAHKAKRPLTAAACSTTTAGNDGRWEPGRADLATSDVAVGSAQPGGNVANVKGGGGPPSGAATANGGAKGAPAIAAATR